MLSADGTAPSGSDAGPQIPGPRISGPRISGPRISGPRISGPRISVVVPVRDRRPLLRALLDALAAQTCAHHEVVVVDDHSSDGAADEARRDADRGRPVRVIDNAGTGAVAARRTGVAAARASLLAFTDSDCVPAPGWLQAGVSALDAGADVAVGVTRPARTPKPLERAVAVVTDDGLGTTSNVFYRRAAYDAAGGFDARAGRRLGFRPGSRLRALGFGEDTLLCWRVRRAGTAAFVPEAVVEHHVHAVDVAESLRRAWTAGAFPALVREVPELRGTLLIDRAFLGSRSRLPLYLAVVAAVGRRRLAARALTLAWIAGRWGHTAGAEWSWRRRVKAMPIELALDTVTAAALLTGSVRSATPVL